MESERSTPHLPPVPNLSQINPFHTPLPTHFLKIHCNINLSWYERDLYGYDS